MTDERTPLTGRTPIGTWIDHPVGGPLIRELLARGGFDEEALAPVRQLPLEQLVTMSRGALSQQVVDDLVSRANGGAAPDAAEEETGWQERIAPGRFDGRTVIVTGAASGIGRATASRIAREGGRVVAADVAAGELDELTAELGSAEVLPVRADITDAEDLERVVTTAGPRIDGLANIAGINDDFGALHEMSDELWQRVFGVNVDGMFRLTRAVLPAMLEAGRGSIVNIASEAALRGGASGVAYTASKHAVVGLTRSAAFMYGHSGIRVNAVAPGGVVTGIASGGAMAEPAEFGSGRLAPLQRMMPPIATAPQLAASITFLLSDDGVNISGAVLPSDGGWSVQ
ncbi:SDR family NAD(P)-dependent oxidoreductase [Salinifilum ghardaiensis]